MRNADWSLSQDLGVLRERIGHVDRAGDRIADLANRADFDESIVSGIGPGTSIFHPRAVGREKNGTQEHRQGEQTRPQAAQ